MPWLRVLLLCLVAGGGAPFTGAVRAEIQIHEIHYHPASHDPSEEFIELWNSGSQAVDLAGWRVVSGVRFQFPEGSSLGPDEYLLVVASPARWANLDGLRATVVGPWDGQLSNSGEDLVLADATGRTRDRVRYAQDGDFGRRVRGPLDHGQRGWIWEAAHDGGGASLERVRAALPADTGQNWAASLVAGGTPGRANSVAAVEVAPLITGVRQDPVVPIPEDSVVVRARLWDELGAAGLRAQLLSRATLGSNVVETVVEMADDGVFPDWTARDGEFAGRLPAREVGTVVEYWIRATDAGARSRTWPPPVWEDGAREDPGPGALYAVEASRPTGPRPELRLILRPSDLAVLRQINGQRPVSPLPEQDQTRSHAEFDATWVALVDGRAEVRHRVSVRNRGNGSRFASPQSFRVNFPGDRPWEGRRAINLASQAPEVQIVGSRLSRLAGLPAATSRPVLLRVNGLPETTGETAVTNSATGAFHALNEVIDGDFLERQFPLDGAGAAYRAQRRDFPLLHAGLEFLGDAADAYRPVYFKRTQGALDDWSDLIGLTRTLAEAGDADYERVLGPAVAVEEWIRYFAVNVLLDNRETSPVNGHGDDYFLVRGERDRRFQLVPYDYDSILGVGGFGGATAVGLFPMVNGRVPVFARFVTHAAIRPRFLGEVARLAGLFGDPARGLAEIDNALRDWVGPARRAVLKDFLAERCRHLRSLVEQEGPGGVQPSPGEADPGKVFLSEWLAAPGPGGPPEFVEIFNPGTTPFDLSGFFLTDQPVGWPRRWAVPVGTVVPPLGTWVVRSEAADPRGALGFRMRAADGELALVMPSGEVMDHVFHAWLPRGVSLGRKGRLPGGVLPLGAPSPGVPQADSGVEWSELQVVPESGTAPWIELVNRGPEPVSTDGWRAAPAPDGAGAVLLPTSDPIAPGERRVILLPEFGGPPAPGGLEEMPRWAAEGGALFLLDGSTSVVDALRWGPQIPGASLARTAAQGEMWEAASPWKLSVPTPGLTNQAVPLPGASRVRVEEWMAAPREGPDWLELCNPSPDPVELSGLGLSDDPEDPERFRFPPHSYLGTGARGCLLVIADRAASRSVATGFALSRSGESLVVSSGERTWDTVAWAGAMEGVSEGRDPTDGQRFRAFPGRSTPGIPNGWGSGPDSNSNGVPDPWERDHGLGPAEDPEADPDGDGQSTRTEWQAGSAPRDGASVLRLRWRTPSGGPLALEETRLEAWVPAGRRVRVEAAGEVSGPWRTLGTLEASAWSGWRRLRAGSTAGNGPWVRLRLDDRLVP